MNELYYLIYLIPLLCIGLAFYVIYKVRSDRNAEHGILDTHPKISTIDTGRAPKIKHADPHEGKIVVPQPLNRTQRRLLKKDAKKWAKKQGLKSTDANAVAEASVRSVVVDSEVYRHRQLGLVK